MPLCPYILKCVHHFRGLMYPFETQLRKLKDLTSQQKKPNCAVCGDQEHRFPINAGQKQGLPGSGGHAQRRQGRHCCLAWIFEALFPLLGSPNLRTRPPPRRESSLVCVLFVFLVPFLGALS